MPQSTPPTNPPAFHIVVTTHTDRHLYRSLLSMTCQSPKPASLTVSVDGEHATVIDVVEKVATRTDTPITCLTRRHMGEARRTQVRNNGARLLMDRGLKESDWLLFLDGDCLAVPGLIAAHGRNANNVNFSSNHFINLTQEQTEALTDEEVLGGRTLTELCEPHHADLTKRQKDYERQLRLRKFGLVKRHKPKLVGGHIAVHVGSYLSVNGFDEGYTAWGFEDDDFTRRMYRKRYRPAIVVDQALLLHQWHPSLRESSWLKNASAKRFRSSWRRPVWCKNGVENPMSQPEPLPHDFGPKL